MACAIRAGVITRSREEGTWTEGAMVLGRRGAPACSGGGRSGAVGERNDDQGVDGISHTVQPLRSLRGEGRRMKHVRPRSGVGCRRRLGRPRQRSGERRPRRGSAPAKRLVVCHGRSIRDQSTTQQHLSSSVDGLASTRPGRVPCGQWAHAGSVHGGGSAPAGYACRQPPSGRNRSRADSVLATAAAR